MEGLCAELAAEAERVLGWYTSSGKRPSCQQRLTWLPLPPLFLVRITISRGVLMGQLLVVGNWKMNGSEATVAALLDEMALGV